MNDPDTAWFDALAEQSAASALTTPDQQMQRAVRRAAHALETHAADELAQLRLLQRLEREGLLESVAVPARKWAPTWLRAFASAAVVLLCLGISLEWMQLKPKSAFETLSADDQFEVGMVESAPQESLQEAVQATAKMETARRSEQAGQRREAIRQDRTQTSQSQNLAGGSQEAAKSSMSRDERAYQAPAAAPAPVLAPKQQPAVAMAMESEVALEPVSHLRLAENAQARKTLLALIADDPEIVQLPLASEEQRRSSASLADSDDHPQSLSLSCNTAAACTRLNEWVHHYQPDFSFTLKQAALVIFGAADAPQP